MAVATESRHRNIFGSVSWEIKVMWSTWWGTHPFLNLPYEWMPVLLLRTLVHSVDARPRSQNSACVRLKLLLLNAFWDLFFHSTPLLCQDLWTCGGCDTGLGAGFRNDPSITYGDKNLKDILKDENQGQHYWHGVDTIPKLCRCPLCVGSRLRGSTSNFSQEFRIWLCTYEWISFSS